VRNVNVLAQNLRGDYRLQGVTSDSALILDVICPPGADPHDEMSVSIPYLQETKNINVSPELAGEIVVVQFAIEAPILPINLP
ncbi:MAG: hypothetical protein AAF633_15130, partial [Chloroflexota bacterium]